VNLNAPSAIGLPVTVQPERLSKVSVIGVARTGEEKPKNARNRKNTEGIAMTAAGLLIGRRRTNMEPPLKSLQFYHLEIIQPINICDVIWCAGLFYFCNSHRKARDPNLLYLQIFSAVLLCKQN
jgi:hypothetical protein